MDDGVNAFLVNVQIRFKNIGMKQFYAKFTVFFSVSVAVMQLTGVDNNDVAGTKQYLLAVYFIVHRSLVYTDTFNVGMPVTKSFMTCKLGQKPFLYGIRKLIGVIVNDLRSVLHNFYIYHKYLLAY